MLLPPIDLTHGTLIRIGAGTSLDIEDRLRADGAPARVILIEPHPDLAKALAARLAGWPQVTVLPVAIGGPDRAMLTLFSNLAHCSLHTPHQTLFDLLPGLRRVGATPVATLSAGQALAPLGDLPHPLHMEIDAPGAEQDILTGLHLSGHLDLVDSLDLRAGAEPLYTGAVGAAALKDWLEQAGFRLQQAGSDDPDWPELRLTADRQRRALEQALAQAAQTAGAQSAQIADLNAALADTRNRFEQHVSDLAARDDLIARHQSDLSDQRHAVESGAHAHAEQVAGLERDLTQLREQSGADHRRIADLDAALSAASAASAAADNSATTMAALAQSRAAELDAVSSALAGEKAAVKKAHAAADMTAADFAAAERASAAKLNDLANVAAARSAKVAELEQALATARQGRDAKAKALAEAEAALATAQAAHAGAEVRVKELTGRDAALTAKVAELEQALATARQGRDAKAKALTEVEAALTSAQAAHAGAEVRVKELAGRDAALTARVAELEQALGTARQGAEGKAKALTEAEAKVKALTDGGAARSAKMSELEQALIAARQGRDAMAKALAEAEAAVVSAQATNDEGAAKIRDLTDIAARRAAKVAEVESRLATAAQGHDDAGRAAAARGQTLETAVAGARATSDALAAKMAAAEELHRATVSGMEKQTESLDADLGHARQDLAIAMRLQAIAQADLRALQQKFADMAVLKDEQEGLLRKLMPRLQEAAIQFRGLMDLPPATSLVAPIAVKPKKSKKTAKRGKAK